MLIHEVVGHYGLGLFGRLIKLNHGIKNRDGPEIDRNKSPVIPQGFGCFVCGSTFDTNQERLMHLETFKHLDLYNTGSPQEREEVRRLSF